MVRSLQDGTGPATVQPMSQGHPLVIMIQNRNVAGSHVGPIECCLFYRHACPRRMRCGFTHDLIDLENGGGPPVQDLSSHLQIGFGNPVLPFDPADLGEMDRYLADQPVFQILFHLFTKGCLIAKTIEHWRHERKPERLEGRRQRGYDRTCRGVIDRPSRVAPDAKQVQDIVPADAQRQNPFPDSRSGQDFPKSVQGRQVKHVTGFKRRHEPKAIGDYGGTDGDGFMCRLRQNEPDDLFDAGHREGNDIILVASGKVGYSDKSRKNTERSVGQSLARFFISSLPIAPLPVQPSMKTTLAPVCRARMV